MARAEDVGGGGQEGIIACVLVDCGQQGTAGGSLIVCTSQFNDHGTFELGGKLVVHLRLVARDGSLGRQGQATAGAGRLYYGARRRFREGDGAVRPAVSHLHAGGGGGAYVLKGEAGVPDVVGPEAAEDERQVDLAVTDEYSVVAADG